MRLIKNYLTLTVLKLCISLTVQADIQSLSDLIPSSWKKESKVISLETHTKDLQIDNLNHQLKDLESQLKLAQERCKSQNCKQKQLEKDNSKLNSRIQEIRAFKKNLLQQNNVLKKQQECDKSAVTKLQTLLATEAKEKEKYENETQNLLAKIEEVTIAKALTPDAQKKSSAYQELLQKLYQAEKEKDLKEKQLKNECYQRERESAKLKEVEQDLKRFQEKDRNTAQLVKLLEKESKEAKLEKEHLKKTTQQIAQRKKPLPKRTSCPKKSKSMQHQMERKEEALKKMSQRIRKEIAEKEKLQEELALMRSNFYTVQKQKQTQAECIRQEYDMATLDVKDSYLEEKQNLAAELEQAVSLIAKQNETISNLESTLAHHQVSGGNHTGIMEAQNERIRELMQDLRNKEAECEGLENQLNKTEWEFNRMQESYAYGANQLLSNTLKEKNNLQAALSSREEPLREKLEVCLEEKESLQKQLSELEEKYFEQANRLKQWENEYAKYNAEANRLLKQRSLELENAFQAKNHEIIAGYQQILEALETKEDQYKQACQQQRKLKMEIQQRDKKIGKLQRTNSEHRNYELKLTEKLTQEKKEAVERTETRLQEKMNEISESMHKLQDIEEQNKVFKEHIDLLAQENYELEQELELNKAKTAIEKPVEDSNGWFLLEPEPGNNVKTQEMLEMESSMLAMNLKLQKNKDKIGQLKQKLSSNKAKNSQLKAKIKHMNNTLDKQQNIQSQLLAKDNLLESREMELKETQNLVKSLDNETIMQQATVNQIVSKLSSLEEAIAINKAHSKKAIKHLTLKLQTERQKMSQEAKQELKAYESKMEYLLENSKKQNSKIESLKKALQQANIVKTDLETEVGLKETELCKAKESLNILQNLPSSTDEEKRTLENQVNLLVSEVGQLENETLSLMKEKLVNLENLKDEKILNEQLTQSISSLSRENQDLSYLASLKEYENDLRKALEVNMQQHLSNSAIEKQLAKNDKIIIENKLYELASSTKKYWLALGITDPESKLPDTATYLKKLVCNELEFVPLDQIGFTYQASDEIKKLIANENLLKIVIEQLSPDKDSLTKLLKNPKFLASSSQPQKIDLKIKQNEEVKNMLTAYKLAKVYNLQETAKNKKPSWWKLLQTNTAEYLEKPEIAKIKLEELDNFENKVIQTILI